MAHNKYLIVLTVKKINHYILPRMCILLEYYTYRNGLFIQNSRLVTAIRQERRSSLLKLCGFSAMVDLIFPPIIYSMAIALPWKITIHFEHIRLQLGTSIIRSYCDGRIFPCINQLTELLHCPNKTCTHN